MIQEVSTKAKNVEFFTVLATFVSVVASYIILHGAKAEYFWVMLLGSVVGATELISRYKDAPIDALLSKPGVFYLFFNAVASLVALEFLLTYQVDFSLLETYQVPSIDKLPEDGLQKYSLQLILCAGLSAAVFFRTSIFNVRIGENDVNVGPAAVLQIILKTIDRTVDRGNADRRAEEIKDVLDPIDLRTTARDLPIVCFSLMSNLSLEETQYFEMKLKLIESHDGVSDTTKQIAIGCALSDLVGLDVLKKAVALCDNVKEVAVGDEFMDFVKGKQEKEQE